MTPAEKWPRWSAPLVALAGLGALYADALRTGFLNDDHLFLEQARQPFLPSLAHLGALGNYYRPLSRQIYFALLTPLAGHAPLAFHLVNAALFAVSLALLLDVLIVLVPWPGALAGALYFALIPFQRVNLIWVSCSQDLLALALSLGGLALFRRGRDGWACAAYLGAIASKEVAFPLPAALALWLALGLPAGGTARDPVAARGGRSIAHRLAPFVAIGIAWLVLELVVRARDHAFDRAGIHVTPEWFAAAVVHGIQSLIGLDHPSGFLRGLAENSQALVPLILLAALALWIGGAAGRASTATPRTIVSFAAGWTVLFSLPAAPVAHTWSAYYYTLAAVGGAILVGLACRRIDRWGWVLLTAALLWWHAGIGHTRAFAVVNRPWGWTSHLMASYFERGAALNDSLGLELERIAPRPAHGTRFFFATLPPWAGFQMGNGAAIRERYRDPTLASYFYSQFSDSTAGDHPCRFLYWDGVAFRELYRGSDAPWFQVGSDLMLFGEPAGAAHAFRRGLAEGEGRTDHLYWLGWAELERGRRPAAEAAWKAFGAMDDTAAYHRHLAEASAAVVARDTVTARRRLFDAVRAGIGRPEAHTALGRLLERVQLKYALMELQVSLRLDPRDIGARRDLIAGLVAVRLDDAARREFTIMERMDPGWRKSPEMLAARRVLDQRSNEGATVVEF